MHSDGTWPTGEWLEPIVAVALGTIAMVAVATICARFARSAVWRRTIWQAATLGIVALLLIEWTGTGSGVAELLRTRGHETVTPPDELVHAAASERPEEQTARERDLHHTPHSAAKQRAVEPPRPAIHHDYGEPPIVLESPATEPPAPRWQNEPAVEPVPYTRSFEPLAETVFDEHTTSPQTAASEPVPVDLAGDLTRGEANAARPAGQPVETTGETVALRVPSDRTWLAWVWALGVVVLLGRFVWAQAALWVFVGRSRPMDDPALHRRITRLAHRLHIRRSIRLLHAPGLRAPVAFGTVRPTIALPEEFLGKMDDRQQDAVLLHELAHLASCDAAWQSLASMLCAILWWHPIVWWLRRQLHAASETAADEASLLIPDGPNMLASCLVTLGRQLTGPTRLSWLSIEGPGFRSDLGRRIERLLNLHRNPCRVPGRGRLTVARTVLPLIAIIVTISCTAWARPTATLPEGEKKMSALTRSWKTSLAAATLTALFGPLAGHVSADEGPAVEQAQFVMAQEEGEREEGERREAREREEGERREAREREERGVAEQREAVERERAQHAEAMQRELHGLEERAVMIKRRMEGLRDGQDGAARELRAAMDQIEERANAIRRELGDRGGERREGERREGEERERPERARHLEELEREHAQLQERAAHLRRELEGARDGDEGARRLMAEYREIQQRLEQIKREAQGGERREGAGREQLGRQLEEIEREIHRLSEAGKHDQAEALKRRGRELVERSKQPQEPRRRDVPEDVERRVRHLRVAVENLEAAGLHDQARALANQIERMLGRDGEPDRPRPERRDAPPVPERVGRAIEEIHGQMRQMHREMEELRGLVRELLQRERGGDRAHGEDAEHGDGDREHAEADHDHAEAHEDGAEIHADHDHAEAHEDGDEVHADHDHAEAHEDGAEIHADHDHAEAHEGGDEAHE